MSSTVNLAETATAVIAAATASITSVGKVLDQWPYEEPTGTINLTARVYDADPYLQYQPAFAYTLPIQLFVAGITLTLLCVLLIHLLFTAQYHYPLAPLNFMLQFCSIVVVIVSVCIKIVVVMRNSNDNADVWPYDLDYVAVPIPPPWWTLGQDAAWFFLQALNLGLSNITHIQFLTLLYPSRTEARLIIFILGPLAIASSGLVFTALAPSQTILDIGDAIRNVFNSCLLLIFTIALFIWGFFVNRRRAWRFDGGTAIFGFGSLFLAVISTTFNFVAVKEDGIDWLQHLLFAAILWQTWLGWWWWVGSGMGIGEVEDLMERAERKKRKAARKAARMRGTPKRTRSTSFATLAESPVAALTGLSSSVTGILRSGSMIVRRRTSQSVGSGNAAGDVEEGIEMDNLTRRAASDGGVDSRKPRHPPVVRSGSDYAARSGVSSAPDSPELAAKPGTPHVEFSDRSSAGRPGIRHSTNSETSSTSQTPSIHTPHTVRQFLSLPTTLVQIYLRRLRHAHEDAAKAQALSRAELRAKVFAAQNEASASASPAAAAVVGKGKTRAAQAEHATAEGEEIGWGLGSFGIREHREGAKRLARADELLKGERLLGKADANGHRAPNDADGAGGGGMAMIGEDGPGESEAEERDRRENVFGRNAEAGPGPSTARRPSRGAGVSTAAATAGEEEGAGAGTVRHRRASAMRREEEKGEDEWEDITNNTSSSSSGAASNGAGGRGGLSRRQAKKAKAQRQAEEHAHRRSTQAATGSGWSWWGPLKDWRLNDRSHF